MRLALPKWPTGINEVFCTKPIGTGNCQWLIFNLRLVFLCLPPWKQSYNRGAVSYLKYYPLILTQETQLLNVEEQCLTPCNCKQSNYLNCYNKCMKLEAFWISLELWRVLKCLISRKTSEKVKHGSLGITKETLHRLPSISLSLKLLLSLCIATEILKVHIWFLFSEEKVSYTVVQIPRSDTTEVWTCNKPFFWLL